MKCRDCQLYITSGYRIDHKVILCRECLEKADWLPHESKISFLAHPMQEEFKEPRKKKPKKVKDCVGQEKLF